MEGSAIGKNYLTNIDIRDETGVISASSYFPWF